jgi:hypothetical protein
MDFVLVTIHLLNGPGNPDMVAYRSSLLQKHPESASQLAFGFRGNDELFSFGSGDLDNFSRNTDRPGR